MSKIGKQPIEIPAGVTVSVEGEKVVVSGPQGRLELMIRPEVKVTVEGNVVKVLPARETKKTPALWGLTRALVFNMVSGAVKKFEKKLEISGIGFNASVQGKDAVLNVGFTHPVKIPIPEGIEIKVEKNVITVAGHDKELVGSLAAAIRSKKKPEPYKGKGIYYAGEKIRRKAGKKLASAA